MAKYPWTGHSVNLSRIWSVLVKNDRCWCWILQFLRSMYGPQNTLVHGFLTTTYSIILFSLCNFSDVMFHWYFHWISVSKLFDLSMLRKSKTIIRKFFSSNTLVFHFWLLEKLSTNLYFWISNGYNFGIEMDFGKKRKSKKYHCITWISRLSPRICHYHG